ncbi:FAD-binding protein [Candidatus Nitrosotalea bavarica]|uniref:FAD-binding protein n=1 Tax=Candidatus Nitrosotalea bavarica TaxID=1903277 RepID=UPI000C7110FF|nr:NAD(P)/FAD-dependent oxidoreductase [Candidatus Nitrosotalea bavarica]
MEKYDVVIVGGGSSGLAALKQLSNRGKQAILLESGGKVGSKSVSGGILYSKKPKKANVHNVEDVYENFLTDAPVERKITKYILHSTSKDKVFSMDLTSAHEYEANFGYSVLMNKLNKWFADQANESAQKYGGGIIPGVHVRDIKWDGDKTIIYTDELEEIQASAVIASDGVNSEIANITGARKKFSPSELYQGVKVVVKLPEDIINERFGVSSQDGAAHLFAGDVTLNHIGGGFVYTNKNTLSVGGVYHLDSLLENPVEPYEMINALLKNPMISEFVKDQVPVKKEIDKNLSKEEQIRIRFATTKLIKSWQETRDAVLSSSGRDRLIKSGKYASEDEIRTQLSSLQTQMADKYGVTLETDYVEVEYSAKLIPDGKRGRMKNPFIKNVLFTGDAAGRGIFIGPKIEGLNVGIDDAVRAANTIADALEKNNLSHDNLGKSYSNSLEESHYTKDMKEIDKDYLKIFLDTAKDIPRDILSSKYGMVIKLMSNDTLRNFSVGFANILGYEKLLPLVESEETYVKVPMELADRLGEKITSSYTMSIPSIATRIGKLNFSDDEMSHIKVIKPASDFMKKMVTLCPTRCYSIENDKVMIQHEGCIECGTCYEETDWKHTRGEKGITYQYG